MEITGGSYDTGISTTFMRKQVYDLEGIFYKDRLIAVYFSKGYSVKW